MEAPKLANYRGVCNYCGDSYDVGALIVRNFASGMWVHLECSIASDVTTNDKGRQTIDEHYNALCQTLDRIMTGNPKIIAKGGARSSVAETLRDEASSRLGMERAVVRFDHVKIKKWSKNGFDRTALTLALNIHELGHIWHSPAASGSGRRAVTADVRRAFNMLEDQRQEILTALQYPRAVDYLRYLNARGLQLAVQEGFIGRSFLLQYGRRHLYPVSVNTRLETEAVKKYGRVTTDKIKAIIDEFLRLSLPHNLNRAWQLARQLAEIDGIYDPPWKSGPLNNGDPRHDCVPSAGSPTLDQETRDRLTRKIRRLVLRPTTTKEPVHKELPKEEESDERQEEVSQEPEEEGSEPEFGEEGFADKLEEKDDGEEKQGSNREQEGGEAEQKSDPIGQSEEGDGGASPEAEASAENEESEGSDGDDGPLVEAEVEPSESNSSTGHGDPRTIEIEEKLAEILSDLEDAAIEQVRDEITSRHAALKSSELMPSLGGSKRGALNPLFLDAARRTARLFEDINQDLKAITRRGQRRGRLDSRRVITSITSNNLRIFKRRVKDLTQEAALAVHIFIDTSGSMNDPADPSDIHRKGPSKLDIALPAGFALAKAVEVAGHVAKVTTFSEHCIDQKDWLDECYRVSRPIENTGTYAAEGLRKAIPSFIYVEKELEIHNHVLILLTDGNLGDSESSTKYLQHMVKGGVYVIEIGIGVDPLPLSGAWKIMNIKGVGHLSKAMADPLAKLSIEIAKNVRRKIA